ncbi:MAG: dihydrodipicolinate synthase family protein [Nitrososphaeria archaeon]|nr:dihydrodipicolinate synthase family protein [Nitrososphaeria archaeon]
MEPSELKERYVGVQVVMVTPFKKDYSLDEEGLKENVHYLLRNGVHVLHPTGSTGEFWNLTTEEHKRVIKIVVNEVGGKVPVIPGTGYSGTKQTIEISKYAEDIGADGVLVLPPYYVVPTPEGIYQHFKTLSESIKIGIIVYNNPSMTKISLSNELLKRLATLPNIVAVKDTTRDIIDIFLHLYALSDKLTFSVGLGELQAPYFYLSGGKGHISELANFAPKLAVQMYDFALKRNWDQMIQLHKSLYPYFEFVERKSRESGGMIWISIIKEAMRLLNLPGWPPRKPLLPLDEKDIRELTDVLKEIGLLSKI